MSFKHSETVAAKLRSNAHGIKLLSPLNDKTPKGEALGYLTAMLYLAPHTLAGGKSICPHSTAACREVCLFHAGRGSTPRVFNARIRRTLHYLERRSDFLADLFLDLQHMQAVADEHEMKLAIRLNGTSDILWERETLSSGRSIFEAFPRATFYDYTRTPLHHRKVPANWRLVFSLADEPVEVARDHLRAGHSVAVVVPEDEKPLDGYWFALDGQVVTAVDGDAHDLRFLDPAPALVLLKPKGSLRRGGAMLRKQFLTQIQEKTR